MTTSTHENRSSQNTLFVWDGSDNHIWHAEKCLEVNGGGTVRVVSVRPSEPFAHRGVIRDTGRFEAWKQAQQDQFDEAVKNTTHLRGIQLEFLFGDRIREIVNFADSNNVDAMLLPRFEQSTFTKWMLGDLNDQIVRQANCSVLFMESEFGTLLSDSKMATAQSNEFGDPELGKPVAAN